MVHKCPKCKSQMQPQFSAESKIPTFWICTKCKETIKVSPESLKKVLIIDDDIDILKTLDLNYRFQGYNVLTARNAEEGFALALNKEPDLIVLDINLPMVDGWQLCSLLKSSAKMCNIPIILITAFHEDPLIDNKIKASGADNLFPKPLDMSKLLLYSNHVCTVH